jgi:acylphosphatase
MTERVTKRLVVKGLVQGVFFRESMRIEAERLGITGWVCNRKDGTVEAFVQGSAHAVEAITKWAHRGPDDARVSGVEIFEASGEFAKFEKRPTF